MFYTDTHAHVHMKPLKYSAEDVIKRARDNNVKRIITVGITAEDSQNAVALAEKHPELYATIGVHPHDAQSFDFKQLGLFEELAGNRKVVAVGEVGLDFYRNISPKDKQTEVFSTMIDLALSAELPLIIHGREAAVEIIEVFNDMLGGVDHRILFHCFSGDQELIDWGMARENVMFSFAGNVTYPKAVQLHDALAQLPLDRLFIETDCPYLAPLPNRGKQNEPSYLPYTAEFVAKSKKATLEALQEQLETNFHRFFKL